jgi:hypothetical protein
MPSMKLSAFAIALVSGACLLSACGSANTAKIDSSGAGRSHGSTARAAINSGLAIGRPPSRAQALAFVHAVNLSASDIPESSLAPKLPHSSSAREKSEEHVCERLAPNDDLFLTHHLAEASSPRLKRGQELEAEELSSAVTVQRNERAVGRVFTALQTPRVRACLARVLTHNFSEKAVREARWGRFSISKIPISAPGATAALGLRVTGTLNFAYTEVSLPVYVDVLGFAMGPAGVLISAVSVTQPVPTVTEQELVALLLARAKAHPL